MKLKFWNDEAIKKKNLTALSALTGKIINTNDSSQAKKKKKKQQAVLQPLEHLINTEVFSYLWKKNNFKI